MDTVGTFEMAACLAKVASAPAFPISILWTSTTGTLGSIFFHFYPRRGGQSGVRVLGVIYNAGLLVPASGHFVYLGDVRSDADWTIFIWFNLLGLS